MISLFFGCEEIWLKTVKLKVLSCNHVWSQVLLKAILKGVTEVSKLVIYKQVVYYRLF